MRCTEAPIAALFLAGLLLAGCGQAPQRPAAPGPAKPAPAAPAVPSAERHRSIDELRLHAARRIVAANPTITYMGEPQNVLLAIPVLEIEVNGDGSVRRIEVLRYPGQARDTTQLAIDAVKRAAPFGDVSRVPKPWKFTETFLFNDDRRFKPRTLN